MKKFAYICLIFLVQSICCLSPIICHASSQTTYFARVKYSNVALYKSPTLDNHFDNVYFYIEPSYFVEVMAKVSDDFYQARYIDQIGYVKSSDVEFVSGTPTNPYADNVSFRVFAQNGLCLRATPIESEGISNRITIIPFLETNLQYIGSIEGEEAISNRGKNWYYCKYYRLDEVLTGYVYAGYCDMLTQISPNNEQLSIIPEPSFNNTSTEEISKKIGDGSIDELSKKSQIIIIVAVCIPALLIIYLLFKPTKIVASTKSTSKKSSDAKKKKKRYHDDYYEIED